MHGGLGRNVAVMQLTNRFPAVKDVDINLVWTKEADLKPHLIRYWLTPAADEPPKERNEKIAGVRHLSRSADACHGPRTREAERSLSAWKLLITGGIGIAHLTIRHRTKELLIGKHAGERREGAAGPLGRRVAC
jgi:hypothetical protein